jgi:hypothetical protein
MNIKVIMVIMATTCVMLNIISLYHSDNYSGNLINLVIMVIVVILKMNKILVIKIDRTITIL